MMNEAWTRQRGGKTLGVRECSLWNGIIAATTRARPFRVKRNASLRSKHAVNITHVIRIMCSTRVYPACRTIV